MNVQTAQASAANLADTQAAQTPADSALALFEVAKRGMPRNGTTGRAYRGGNALALLEVAADEGYASNVWLTFNQARELGGKVRKGSSGVQCRYYGQAKAGAESSPDAVQGEGAGTDSTESAKGSRPVGGRPFYVFNVAQIDNLPELPALPTDAEEGLNAMDFLIDQLEVVQARVGGLQ